MKRLIEVITDLAVRGPTFWNSNDTDARPVLIRMREGSDFTVVFYVETDDAPASPGSLSLGFYPVFSWNPYPNPSYRYFSSCLSPDGTKLIHGLYSVIYTTRPSRNTQPELAGPPGPPGPAGAMGPVGPIGVTWSTGT